MSSGADVPRGGWCRGARSELQHGGECGLGLHPLQQLALRDDTAPIRIQLIEDRLQDPSAQLGLAVLRLRLRLRLRSISAKPSCAS